MTGSSGRPGGNLVAPSQDSPEAVGGGLLSIPATSSYRLGI